MSLSKIFQNLSFRFFFCNTLRYFPLPKKHIDDSFIYVSPIFFTGVDQEGLAAVQVALQELEAPGCIGTLQERQRAAAKLEVVAKDGTEMEIQAPWICAR